MRDARPGVVLVDRPAQGVGDIAPISPRWIPDRCKKSPDGVLALLLHWTPEET
jgi:hypothetical protein